MTNVRSLKIVEKCRKVLPARSAVEILFVAQQEKDWSGKPAVPSTERENLLLLKIKRGLKSQTSVLFYNCFLHSDNRHRKHQQVFVFLEPVNRFHNSRAVWLGHFHGDIVGANDGKHLRKEF